MQEEIPEQKTVEVPVDERIEAVKRPKEVEEVTDMPGNRWIGSVEGGNYLVEMQLNEIKNHEAILVQHGRVVVARSWIPTGEDVKQEMNHFLALCCLDNDVCEQD